ncbi:MAG: hypothetical protein WA880_08970 [Ornithinimicrobium sp.]
MATNDDTFGSGTHGDSGPTVRRMSPDVRSHARGVLLAEAVSGSADHDHDGEGGGVHADTATLGRDGFDGAPAPLKKRWMVLAAGLAVAAAGAAIIVGSGVISGDDIGLSPADTTTSQDESNEYVGDKSDRDGNPTLSLERVRCLNQAGAPRDDTSSVAYEHRTDDYTMVAVTYGMPQMCAETSEGSSWSSSRENSGEVGEFIRQTSIVGDRYTELLGGKVADDVTAIDIQADGEVVASAHLEDGWFSAFATTEPSADLSYLVTMRDGTSKTVVVDDPMYQDPAEMQADWDDSLSELAGDCFDEGYELMAAHGQPTYLFFAANTGDAIESCLSAGSAETKWKATLPVEMPPGAPIEPMEPTPGPTAKGPYPVMGRAAPNVTEVVVVLADGKRRDAYVQDGFYSLALPATDAVDLSYEVETDDGKTTTIGSG